jgi:ABC-type multidrug transport system fused ATPase/permease subunit
MREYRETKNNEIISLIESITVIKSFTREDLEAKKHEDIQLEQIKKSLDAIKKERTVIIISHSISQIIDAEYVIVQDNGRVVEQGTHEDLYKNEKTYYQIFQSHGQQPEY